VDIPHEGQVATPAREGARYVSAKAPADRVPERIGVGAELLISDWPFQCATFAVQ
jgi:hypothetical protein